MSKTLLINSNLDYIKIPTLYKECIKDCINILKNDSKIMKIILFGSTVKSKLHTGSDIDLVIIYNNIQNQTKRNLMIYLEDSLYSINNKYPDVDLYLISTDFISETQRKIIEGGVVLYEKESV